ncbi:MAG: hypothetical protein PHC75_04155 [Burkholderiales bacterium]|nr:hypothetical protein [Burkholderiales bacterium]
MKTIISLRHQFRANITAHALAFIINVTCYIALGNPIFIWIQTAVLSFIGAYHTKSNKFFDRNIFNHFVIVMLFYILSIPLGIYHATYFILIMVFTYCFFILRNNGFDKSLNVWMFVQALLIGTTLTDYPMKNKLLATLTAYIEAQILLNISFKLFPNYIAYVSEQSLLSIKNLTIKHWFDHKNPGVQLAIRGSTTATILYAICISINDLKPNWAVVAVVSCLLREDNTASIRSIKALLIGVVIGGFIAQTIHPFMLDHHNFTVMGIWICMIIALACSLEISIKPNLYLQATSSGLFLIATSLVGISLGVTNVNFILLRADNTVIGAVAAFFALLFWAKINQFFNKIT